MENPEKAIIYRMHAEFCKTLSDANRLLIISELSKGEVSVNELARRLELRQSNVSKHLAIMRERGLVTTRREGSTICYSLSDPRISQAISLLRDVQADQIEKQRVLAHSIPEFFYRQVEERRIMSTYEYECVECGERFEQDYPAGEATPSQDEIVCPKCGTDNVLRLDPSSGTCTSCSITKEESFN